MIEPEVGPKIKKYAILSHNSKHDDQKRLIKDVGCLEPGFFTQSIFNKLHKSEPLVEVNSFGFSKEHNDRNTCKNI